jgi:type I restriction enzyme M protein
MLVEKHKLDAVVKLPSGVFRPYAGVSTAILVFIKTGLAAPTRSGSTTCRPTVFRWMTSARRFCRRRSWAWRRPRRCLPKNNLPDVLARWEQRAGAEQGRPHAAKSFWVPKADIAASGGYDLSLNRYKELEHAEAEHASATDILKHFGRWKRRFPKGSPSSRGCSRHERGN